MAALTISIGSIVDSPSKDDVMKSNKLTVEVNNGDANYDNDENNNSKSNNIIATNPQIMAVKDASAMVGHSPESGTLFKDLTPKDKHSTSSTSFIKSTLKKSITSLTWEKYINTHDMDWLGARTKEMLGIKWSDISINPNDDNVGKAINRLVHIHADNSKTGRSRDIIAPIAPQLKRLLKWYKEFGLNVDEKSNDYIFPRLTYTDANQNIPTTDIAWKKRLNYVMKGAERDGVWESKGRRITNYSARHHFITEAIQRGVDIYDIALNCGTSINYIEKTYSHVTVQMRSKDITKGLGVHRLYEPITE